MHDDDKWDEHSSCIHDIHHPNIIDMTFILYDIHYKYDMI